MDPLHERTLRYYNQEISSKLDDCFYMGVTHVYISSDDAHLYESIKEFWTLYGIDCHMLPIPSGQPVTQLKLTWSMQT